MKNLVFLLLALVVMLSSCRKEEIELEEVITDTENPKEIEGVFFRGQVTDQDDIGVQTSIKVYQNDLLVGELLTDTEGFYNTAAILLESGPEVTFAIEETNYLNKYRRLSSDVIFNDQFDLRLYDKGGFNAQIDKPLDNPGSVNLVKAFVFMTDSQGTPIENALLFIAHNLMESNDGLVANGAFDKTDEKGYAEVLVPVGTNLYFHSSIDANDFNFSCYSFFNETDTTFLAGFPFEILGTQNENFELTERSNISLNKTNYSIVGYLLACDETPVLEGEVKLDLIYESFGSIIRETFSTNSFSAEGEFIIDAEVCFDDILNIEISATDLEGSSIFLESTLQPGSTDLSTLVLCDSPHAIISLIIGSEAYTFTYDSLFPDPEYLHHYVTSFTNFGISEFAMNDIVLGANPVASLDLNLISPIPHPYGFTANDNELVLTVSQITADKIIGNLSGDVETNEMGIQTITGEVVINLK